MASIMIEQKRLEEQKQIVRKLKQIEKEKQKQLLEEEIRLKKLIEEEEIRIEKENREQIEVRNAAEEVEKQLLDFNHNQEENNCVMIQPESESDSDDVSIHSSDDVELRGRPMMMTMMKMIQLIYQLIILRS